MTLPLQDENSSDELRIGSTFSGYGGLDLAVEAVTGGRTVWHSEIDDAASRVLAHRWPGVPNLGDITAVDWSQVEPVDVLCGGSPCQDVSAAGKRAGMRAGTRSGLWASMCDAIDVLRPSLVVWENVRGVTSACADSEMGQCPRCVGGSGPHRPVLRALGRVVGDLSDLGYVCRWVGLPASAIGAPHGRYRIFVAAVPANLGHERGWTAWRRRTGPADRSLAPADADRDALRQQPVTVPGRSGEAVAELAGTAAAHTASARPARVDDGTSRAAARGGRERLAAGGVGDAPVPDAESDGRDEGRTESAGLVGGSDAPECSQSLNTLWRREQRAATARAGSVAWGKYEPAIRQWERLTRPVPHPTTTGAKGGQQLSGVFDEWLMGLPAGWVTDVPGISNNDALRLCGNGVVPQQAAEAQRRLLSFDLSEAVA